MIFDTLKVSQKLRENGRFTEDQAVALAEAFSAGSMDNLATKADINEFRASTKADLRTEISGVRLEIAELRTELRTENAKLRTEVRELENRILLKMAAMFAFALGFIHFVK